jgi:spore coat protein B
MPLMDENYNLSALIGRRVRIDRGGPESRSGRLISVKPDHAVVYVEGEGILYYKTSHIKSISLDARDYSDLNTLYDMPSSYLDVETFDDVLRNLKYHWVQINRGGPEKVEGVLSDSYADRVLLIINNEIITILKYHIRNISYGVSKENKNKENNENKAENKNKENKVENRAESKEKQQSGNVIQEIKG